MANVGGFGHSDESKVTGPASWSMLAFISIPILARQYIGKEVQSQGPEMWLAAFNGPNRG